MNCLGMPTVYICHTLHYIMCMSSKMSNLRFALSSYQLVSSHDNNNATTHNALLHIAIATSYPSVSITNNRIQDDIIER